MKHIIISAKKGISIFLLLTLLSVNPLCALADSQNMPPSPDSRESFDQMKTRMTESIDITIENIESSEVNFDNESLSEASEKLIVDLNLRKEKLSNAETEDDLIKIKQELDTLLNTAPEELKNVPGLPPHNIGSRPNIQNSSENFSQYFKNRPEIINNRSQPEDLNITMNNSRGPGQRPARMEEKNNSANLTVESDNEKGGKSSMLTDFLGKLIRTLKSLFN